REEAALHGESRDLDGVVRGRPPSERTRDVHVQVAGAVHLHGRLDLVLEIVKVGHAGGGDVRNSVSHGDERRVLAVPELVPGLRAEGRRRRGAGERRRGARALHARVHVRLVVVANVQNVVVSLEHARQGTEADVHRPAVAALSDDAHRAALRPHRRCDPRGDGRGVRGQRMEPGNLPGRLGVGRREHLETARGVDDHELASGRTHGGVEHPPRAERLAASLARAVAARQRVAPVDRRLHGARLRVEQAVAGGQRAGLVELDPLAHPILRIDGPTSRSTFDAVGPGGRVSGMRATSRSTTPQSRSSMWSSPSLPAWPSANTRPSDACVIARPPRPATTVCTTVCTSAGSPRSAIRTSDASTPPIPRARFFSTTMTRRAPRSASRTAAAGNGRNVHRSSAPMGTPPARIASTTTSIVPFTDPIATTIVSAPSVRYGRSRPPDRRPKRCSNSDAISGMISRARSCLWCASQRTSANASGPTIAPIVIGSAGSITCTGSYRGRNASTSPCVGTSTRSKACVRMKPSTQTITGQLSASARRNAWMWRSAASWLSLAKSWIQPASRIAIASERSFQMLI